MLTLNNCTIGYGKKVILNNVSLSVGDNEIVGIMGGNGSGKTTLLKTISSIIDLIGGEYLLDGKEIAEYKTKERAKKISYLPQKNGIVYSVNVLDVVLMGVTPYLSMFGVPSEEHRKEAVLLLEQSNILYLKDKNFLELSEGEKQLVLIAKNLMQKSEIMIFDEPSSSLDFNNTYMFMDNIARIIKDNKKSAIITIHDPNLALLYCDKIIAMKDNCILNTLLMYNANIDEVSKTLSDLYSDITVTRHKNKFHVIKECRKADEI